MGLRDLGYIEGRSLTVAYRWPQTAERLPEVAADLVRLKVDVIFATSSTEGGRPTRDQVDCHWAPSHRLTAHAAGQKLGVQVVTVPVRTPEDLGEAFAKMARERMKLVSRRGLAAHPRSARAAR
jgi:hypothetical protein